MMHFLQNLITRHQTEAAQLQPGLIVQPRQKLRFEEGVEPLVQAADLNQDSFSQQEVYETENDRTPDLSRNVSNSSSQDVQNKVPSNTLNNVSALNESADFFVSPQSKNSLESYLSNQLISNSSNEKIPLSVASIESNSGNGDRVSEVSATQDKNQRIQALNSLESLDTSLLITPSAIKPSVATPTSSPARQASSSPAELLMSAGLLQAPDWLTQMSSDLHDRWQAMHQQAPSEPVINVSIGRVEVRAVPLNSAQQTAAKRNHQPSGVMTLDSYLKQRDRRGQV